MISSRIEREAKRLKEIVIIVDDIEQHCNMCFISKSQVFLAILKYKEMSKHLDIILDCIHEILDGLINSENVVKKEKDLIQDYIEAIKKIDNDNQAVITLYNIAIEFGNHIIKVTNDN